MQAGISSIPDLLAGLFPYLELSGGRNPLTSYFIDPFHAISSPNNTPVYAVGTSTFEVPMAQILNTVMMLGIDADNGVTGLFDAGPMAPRITIVGTTTTK